MNQIIESLLKADPFQSWLPFIVAIIVGIVMFIKTLMGGQQCPSNDQLSGQVCIVTGADSGIGYQITKELCLRSAHVIMACKNVRRAEQSMEKLKIGQHNASIEVRYLDLKSIECISNFCKSIKTDFQYINILINNAEVHWNDYKSNGILKTVDNFEIHLQVNYLSMVLLCKELLPLLSEGVVRNGAGRIINTASHSYATGKINLDDPLNIKIEKNNFSFTEAFPHSKLSVILASRVMSKLFAGKNITVNCYTPGFVRGTNHFRGSPIQKSLCARVILIPWIWLFMKTANQGAQTAIYLASDLNIKQTTGKYFNDCEIADITDVAKNDEISEKLFKETLRELKIDTFM